MSLQAGTKESMCQCNDGISCGFSADGAARSSD